MKKFVSGLIIGVMLSITIVYAAVSLTAIESLYSITFFGARVTLGRPAVTINGEYYIPAKQACDALGISFNVNDSAKTLEFGPKPTSQSSISNPAELNKPLTISYSDFIDTYTAEVTVKNVVRGDEAWKMLLAENKFNSPAPEGHEYILAKINFKLLDIPDGKALDLNNTLFNLVSTEGRVYDTTIGVVTPEPKLESDLYKGSSNEGWAVFIVGVDDMNPKIAFGRSYDGTGGIWFKAYK
ncbi:MAG TPA: copper amine oxidase [Clostridia bacterium]|nr:copper amine oxidase [Clostridia bacterium]